MKTGDWLDQRYRLIRVLGEGGQGSVYLAIQERIYKFYAVKVVQKEQETFSRESVELWKRMSHPGLPEIVDIVETEQEICLVMEYVEGQTLEEVLDQHGQPGERKVILWSIQICEILEYLHGQNPPIIFGDIKLSNLILQKDRIVMVDLGSAVLHSSRGKQSGTREYLPPGEKYWEAGMDRDIYALGKCMERLLPDSGRFSSEMKKIQKKCVSSVEKERYQSIQHCRIDLEKLHGRPWILTVMILLTFSIMALAGEKMEKERLAVDAFARYEQLIKQAAYSSIEEQQELFTEAIEMDPACETGYLNLLEIFLEDSCLTVEEEQEFRKILLESRGDGICFEERLRKNETGYGEVAWKTAMAYWYFYQGEGGRNYASQWFARILELQQDNVLDAERREQCRIYAKLGSYRLALEHGDRTGETEVSFDVYWRDLMGLFRLTAGQEGTMAGLYFRQELLVQMERYQLEFAEVGVAEEEMQEVKSKIKEEIQEMKNTNKAIREKKEEILKLLEDGMEE